MFWSSWQLFKMVYNQQQIVKKQSILELLSHNLFQSNWIDGFGRVILLRKKVITAVLVWLNTVIRSDTDFYSNNGKAKIYNLFAQINNVINLNTENTPHHFIYNDDSYQFILIFFPIWEHNFYFISNCCLDNSELN